MLSISIPRFCKRESPKIKTKGRLALAFSSTSKAKAQCKIECRDKDVSPIVLPPINLEGMRQKIYDNYSFIMIFRFTHSNHHPHSHPISRPHLQSIWSMER